MSSDQVFNNDEEETSLVPQNSNILEPHMQLTEGLEELILGQIKIGVSIDMAAKYCGILPSTVHKWMAIGLERGPGDKYYEFVVKVNRLHGTTQRSLLLRLLTVALSPDGDWRSIPKALETFFPDQFGRGSKAETRIQQTINDNRSIIVTSEQLNGASPDYKNMVISKTRESMGLSSSVYDHSKKEKVLDPRIWLEEEQKERDMADELNLDDL